MQIFYSRSGQTAYAIIERLASKYAGKVDLTVATSDFMERQTVHASGAEWVSLHALRELLKQARGLTDYATTARVQASFQSP